MLNADPVCVFPLSVCACLFVVEFDLDSPCETSMNVGSGEMSAARDSLCTCGQEARALIVAPSAFRFATGPD